MLPYPKKDGRVGFMPFLLYTLEPSQSEYRQVSEIKLSGIASPFRKLATDREWHGTDADILSLLDIERPGDHRILIDLKPSDKKNVSLYRLREVWGYSYDEWSPLALRLECLLGDEPQDNPSSHKQRFTGPVETKDFIYEFLYINGGTAGGKWTWGLVGRVNAALLWPDALRYFITSINRQLVEDGSEPLCK
jgi:hypothetical protein